MGRSLQSCIRGPRYICILSWPFWLHPEVTRGWKVRYSWTKWTNTSELRIFSTHVYCKYSGESYSCMIWFDPLPLLSLLIETVRLGWCDAKIFDGRFMWVSLSPILHVLSPHSHQGVDQHPGRVSLCICTGKNDKMRYEKTNRNEKVILWQVKIFLLRGRAARACLCPTSLKEVTVFCRKIHKYLWLGNSVKAQIQRGFKPLNVRTGAIMLIIF